MRSQPEHWRARGKLFGALAIIIAIACLGSVGTVLATSGDNSQAATEVSTILNLDGHEYPAVVARVNGQVISGKVLAQRVYGIEHAAPGAPTVADPVQAALNALIQDEVLRQAASARGITVSAAEVQSDIQQQQQLSAEAGPSAQELLQVAAAYQGDKSVADYWSDPKTIAWYRDILLFGTMRQQIIQQLPTDQQMNPAATDQAVTQFVANQHATVETFIQP